jgi:hypothetical protein
MANKLAVVCSYFGTVGRWRLEKNLYSLYNLKRKGVDLIDVSSGALVPYQKIPVAPNYQCHLLKKKKSGIQLEL